MKKVIFISRLNLCSACNANRWQNVELELLEPSVGHGSSGARHG